jgi:hypothetical protein
MGVPVKVPVEVSREVLNSVHAIEVKKGLRKHLEEINNNKFELQLFVIGA